MRNIAVFFGFTLLAVLILLPVTRSVNTIVGNPVLHNRSLQADGTPGPPFPPKKPRAAAPTFIADGRHARASVSAQKASRRRNYHVYERVRTF